MLQVDDENSSTTKSTKSLTESMFLEHSNTTMTEVIYVDLPK